MQFKFASWNIDSNLGRTEQGFARESHPEWRVSRRMPAILGKITAMDADLLNLQELRKSLSKYGEMIDSLTPLQDHLKSIGYNVLHHSYNNISVRPLQFITAYKKDKFELINTKIKYFTKTPSSPTTRQNTKGKNQAQLKLIKSAIKDHNYGEFFERGTFITHLKHMQTEQMLINFNIHLGTLLPHRHKACELINEFVRQELLAHTNAKIIVAGDFNCFSQAQGEEQIAIIKNATLNGQKLLAEVSSQFYLPNEELAPGNNTFIFYPFDFAPNDEYFKKEIANLPKLDVGERKKAIEQIFRSDLCIAAGGQLDHIFVHSLTKIGKAIISVTPQFADGPKSYSNQDLKTYILKHHHQGPAFASDHQPIIVELKSVESAENL